MERMLGGELQARREYLGITRADLARLLNVREDTLRFWETGKTVIPYRVSSEITAIEEHTDSTVNAIIEAAEKDKRPTIAVYRDTEQNIPESVTDYGISWWRHVAARAHRIAPGIVIGTRKELLDREQ